MKIKQYNTFLSIEKWDFIMSLSTKSMHSEYKTPYYLCIFVCVHQSDLIEVLWINTRDTNHLTWGAGLGASLGAHHQGRVLSKVHVNIIIRHTAKKLCEWLSIGAPPSRLSIWLPGLHTFLCRLSPKSAIPPETFTSMRANLYIISCKSLINIIIIRTLDLHA